MGKITATPTKDLTRDQWLELRYDGLGGSDIASVMGLSKWNTPLNVFNEKTTRHSDFEGNQFTEWGNRLEDVLGQAYAEKTGLKVRKRNALLVNSNYPWLFANVDRLIVGHKKGLEIKTGSAYASSDWGDEGTDQVPDYYKTQAYAYMIVTGYRSWDFAVLLGGNDFRIYTVEYDSRIADRIIEETRHFWYENVLKNIAPDPINLADTALLYSSDNGEAIEADPDIMVDVEALKAIKAKQKNLADEEKDLKLSIASYMRDNAFLVDGDQTLLTYKATTTNRVDSKALKSEFPDVYEAVIKSSTSKRLSIKG